MANEARLCNESTHGFRNAPINYANYVALSIIITSELACPPDRLRLPSGIPGSPDTHAYLVYGYALRTRDSGTVKSAILYNVGVRSLINTRGGISHKRTSKF